MNNLPKNETEFNLLMEEINTKLKERDIPIMGRPLVALSVVCKKFGISLNIAPLSTPAIPGVYEGDSLSSHIYDWFDSKYGNRLKMGGFGSTVILIKGDPWRIRMPMIFGFHFVCDRDITKEIIIMHRPAVSRYDKVINLLHYIEDLTPDLAQELSDAELKEITDFFILSYNALSRMWRICRRPLLKQAKMDLESSADYIFSQPIEYGLSKWSSLQCVEKILKAYINIKGRNYRRTHNLDKLMYQASQMGAIALSQKDILSLQCSASVRYGEIPVSLQQAIDAHQAAVRGTAIISGQIIRLIDHDKIV